MNVCVGTEVNGWLVTEYLMTGFSGTVFRVRDRSTPPRFGILKAHGGPGVGATDEDFEQEIAINAEQPIPGGMPVFFGSGTLADGTRYFITEELEMLPTDSRNGRPKPMTRRQLVRFIRSLCTIVANLHRRYIHCDIKPENIALRNGKPALIDFGCSVKVSEAGKRTVHCGSWEYMAPEVRDAKWVDTRADVYALGVLLHKLCNRKLRRTYESLCLRALSNDPNERPQDVAEFLSAFNASQDRLARTMLVVRATVWLLTGLLALAYCFRMVLPYLIINQESVLRNVHAISTVGRAHYANQNFSSAATQINGTFEPNPAVALDLLAVCHQRGAK